MSVLVFFNGIFLRLVGLFLAGVLAVSGLRAPCPCTTFEAMDPDNLRLNVSVFADVHMMGFFWSQFRLPTESFVQLAASLNDMSRAAQPVDALVLLGDNTQNGQWLEYVWLFGLLQRFNPARETLVTLGNHDLSLNTMSARRSIGRHNFFWRSVDRNMRGSEAYYARLINDHLFVTIAGEGPDCETYISQQQLDWLAETMATAPVGKPVFVFVHQSIHSYRPGVFPRAAQVRAILEEHDNVFVFGGHWHSPFNYSLEYGVHYFNVPSLHAHTAAQPRGQGVQIEVYDNEVVVRARDFINGQWLESYEVVQLA